MCKGCKFLFVDRSVGHEQCMQELSENELEIYFTNDQEGCPYKLEATK